LFRKYLANPEDMTDEEWDQWNKYRRIFSGLLDDLKRNNKLKSPDEMPRNFLKLIETTNRFARAYNMMQTIFEERGKSERFVEHNRDEFGITAEDLPYLYVSQIIAVLITNAELFRNTMLEILKMEDGFFERMGLGALLYELSEVSVRYGTELRDEIETVLRNAMVHGTFWIDGIFVYYCEDMTLENPRTIRLDKLMNEVKRYNIIARCFIWLIGEKASEGFFE